MRSGKLPDPRLAPARLPPRYSPLRGLRHPEASRSRSTTASTNRRRPHWWRPSTTDGHQGPDPLGGRGRTRQPDHPGGREQPRRRLLHREHTGARRPAREGAARSRLLRPPSRRSQAAMTPPGATGSASRRASRCSCTTPRRSPPRQCPTRFSRSPNRSGRARSGFAPSETDFQPLVTSISSSTAPRRRRLAEGPEGQQQGLSRQRDRRRQVNNGESAIGPINHYYWYRLREQGGTGGMHSAVHYYAPGDPGDLVNVSGAAVLASSTNRTDAQRCSRSSSAAPARRRSPTAIAMSTRCAPAWAPARAAPLRRASPSVLTPAELGDGHGARDGAEARSAVGRAGRP